MLSDWPVVTAHVTCFCSIVTAATVTVAAISFLILWEERLIFI